MTKHELKNKPSQIYNCDESGMPLQHKVPKVLSVKGAKKVRQVSSGNKTQITILGCTSATGQVVPPMVVFTESILIHSYQMVKCLVHFMACRLMGGWIKSCSLIGSLNIFLHTLFLKDHSFYYWMGTHLIIH